MALGHQQLMMSFGGASGPTLIYAIDCGRTSGGVVSGWDEDAFFTNGTVVASGWSTPVDTTGVTDPAPDAVYDSIRYNDPQNYVITGLTPSASYLLRLHFSELNSSSREFHIDINGSREEANFLPYVAAGNTFKKAVIREFTVLADGSGEIDINLVSVADLPHIGGFEVWAV